MRKILVILALIGTMFLVDQLKTENMTDIGNFTLAAIGFVLLAAYTIADLGTSSLSLPRVTGYIVSGIVLGPFVTNILSLEVVSELKMFNTLALGLIALNAGLELSFSGLTKVAKTLGATISIKLVLLPAMVGGTIFTLGTYFPELLGSTLLPGHLFALSLVLSALAISTSPAIAIAVSSELKAKGRLVDLVLGSAIFKDIVVVTVLAITIALVKPLLDATSAFSLDVIKVVAKELAVSIAFGALLGGIIIAYVRYVNTQMLLFIFCLIVASAEISSAIHAELLLVFIVAGMTVRNMSPYEHDVLQGLNLVSMPTYIIFFTIAGASIDLNRTMGLFPIAMILVMVRSLVFYLSSQIGGYISNEPAFIRNRAWLGYLPQAGVELGLVAIAASQLDSISVVLSDLGITFVAINLLIGPLSLRFALTAKQSTNDQTIEATPQLSAPDQDFKVLCDEKTIDQIQEFSSKLVDAHKAAVLDDLNMWQSTLVSGLRTMLAASETNKFKRSEKIIEWTNIYNASWYLDKKSSFNRFETAIKSLTENAPALWIAPLDSNLLKKNKNAGLLESIRRFYLLAKFHRPFRKQGLNRAIPLRAIFKIHLDTDLWMYLAESFDGITKTEVAVYQKLLSYIHSGEELDETLDYLRTALTECISLIHNEFIQTHQTILFKVYRDAASFGSPTMPFLRNKVSVTQKIKRLYLKKIEYRNSWAEQFEAIGNNEVYLAALKHQVKLKITHLINEIILKTTSQVSDAYQDLLNQSTSLLTDWRRHGYFESKDAPELLARCKDTEEFFIRLGSNQSRQILQKFNIDTSLHKISQQLTKISATSAGKIRIFQIKNDQIHADSALDTFEIDFGEFLKDILVHELANNLSDHINLYRDQVMELADLIEQIQTILHFSFETKEDTFALEDARKVVESSIKLALDLIYDYERELQSATKDVKGAVSGSLVDVITKLDSGVATRSFKQTAMDQLGNLGSLVERKLRQHRDHPIIYRFYALFSSILRGIDVFQSSDWLSYANGVYKSFFRNRVAFDLKTLDKVLSTNDNLKGLPLLYKRSFTLEPVKTRKFFTANTATLDDILSLFSKWQKGDEPSSCMIVGTPGTGKTSLLNVLYSEIDIDDSYRLDYRTNDCRGNVIKNLALELGCARSFNGVRETLLAHKSVVYIDNLEYWFRPTSSGIKAMQKFIELMITTTQSTFWIITVSQEFHAAYGRFLGLDLVFKNAYTLGHLPKETIKDVIDQRLSLSGTTINAKDFKRGVLSRLLFLSNEEDKFFERLTNISEGNLYNAIAHWLNSTTFEGDKSVVPSLERLMEHFPHHHRYFKRLGAEVMTVIFHINRHGPLSEKLLGDSLSSNRAQIRNALRHLEMHGIIESFGKKVRYYQIKKHLRPSFAMTITRRH